MANRPAPALGLLEGDRDELVRLPRSSSVRAGLAQRARIVLLAADGLANYEIAARVGVTRPTVNLWRNRYAASGLAGLDAAWQGSSADGFVGYMGKFNSAATAAQSTLTQAAGDLRAAADALAGAEQSINGICENLLSRVRAFQAAHATEAQEALARLKDAAVSGENVFAVLMDAARVCSLQQVTEAFFEVGGQYRRNV